MTIWGAYAYLYMRHDNLGEKLLSLLKDFNVNLQITSWS